MTRLVRVPRLTTDYGVAPDGKITASQLPSAKLEREKFSTDLMRDAANFARQLERVQDHVEAALQRTSPFDGGIILSSEDGTTTGLSFTGGIARVIQHRLGRTPQYVTVLSAWSGFPSFYRIDQSTDEDAASIKLIFQNTCKVVLWVGP